MKEYHITSDSGGGHLKKAYPNLAKSRQIICLADELFQGPIKNLDKFLGRIKRKQFWRKIYKGNEHAFIPNDSKNIKKISTLLSEGNKIVIWAGPNTNEELLMVFLIYSFKKYYKQIKVVQFSRQRLTQKEYAHSLGECGYKVAKKLIKLKRNISKDEVKKLVLIWKNLQDKNSLVRKRNSKYTYENLSGDYIDKEILETCTNEFISAAKIIGLIIGRHNQNKPNIEFILYRIKKLVKKNKLNMTGKLSSMRYFKIKLG